MSDQGKASKTKQHILHLTVFGYLPLNSDLLFKAYIFMAYKTSCFTLLERCFSWTATYLASNKLMNRRKGKGGEQVERGKDSQVGMC